MALPRSPDMMRGMTLAPPDHEAIAAEALEAMDGARQIAPFSVRYPGLTLEDAYRILARLCELRTARGERVRSPRPARSGSLIAARRRAGSSSSFPTPGSSDSPSERSWPPCSNHAPAGLWPVAHRHGWETDHRRQPGRHDADRAPAGTCRRRRRRLTRARSPGGPSDHRLTGPLRSARLRAVQPSGCASDPLACRRPARPTCHAAAGPSDGRWTSTPCDPRFRYRSDTSGRKRPETPPIWRGLLTVSHLVERHFWLFALEWGGGRRASTTRVRGPAIVAAI